MSHVDGVDDGVGYGVFGKSNSGMVLWPSQTAGYGVVGESTVAQPWCVWHEQCGIGGRHFANGVWHEQWRQWCVWRESSGMVCRLSRTGTAVVGISYDYGVVGVSNNLAGLYGKSVNDYAAVLDGNVTITGNLQKAGGSFKIDHPLDPANKYLSHSFVESPDMKNVYDGVVVLDNKGKAEIELPDWFGILNKDFRYQLTAIGAPGPNLYIAEEISDLYY